MVAFDTTFLTWIFVPNAKHPAVPDADKRIQFLLADLSGRGDQILIPTPALSELLVLIGKAGNTVLKQILVMLVSLLPHLTCVRPSNFRL